MELTIPRPVPPQLHNYVVMRTPKGGAPVGVMTTSRHNALQAYNTMLASKKDNETLSFTADGVPYDNMANVP